MPLARTYDEFWALGIGAYMWRETKVNGASVLSLLVKVPYVGEGRDSGVEVIRVFPRRTETDWAQAGQVMAWNGNMECPTLHGSLWPRKPDGWHGWLKNGELVAA